MNKPILTNTEILTEASHSQLLSMPIVDANNSSGNKIFAMTSEALFSGTRELLIIHGSEEYRLRLTSQGKLILTK
jgi:hemin uptake protein HemP